MPEFSITAEVFAAAVLNVSAHRGCVVVKLGGSAMEDPVATDACLRSVATLNRLGVPVVLVHGGGKPIDRAMAEAGLTPKKIAGRRYTDDATMAIVVRVLGRELNQSLAKQFRAVGGRAALTGIPLHGEKLVLPGADGKPYDLGRVGSVTRVENLQGLLDEGTVPIIPSIAHDGQGGYLNVNADTAAAAVAGALRADMAVFLTDTPGVLRDRANPDSIIPRLTEQECRELVECGVIDGGMVPKVEACLEALEAGAKTALILDGRVPYSLLDVFLHDRFKGTAISR